MLPHPHSSDLVAADLVLFPRQKLAVKVLLFTTLVEIQQCLISVLKAIPQEAFANSFLQLMSSVL